MRMYNVFLKGENGDIINVIAKGSSKGDAVRTAILYVGIEYTYKTAKWLKTEMDIMLNEYECIN